MKKTCANYSHLWFLVNFYFKYISKIFVNNDPSYEHPFFNILCFSFSICLLLPNSKILSA